jgi:tetratricopeptide (TPR) repeat protein
MEMNGLAEQLLAEGAFYAERGRTLRAALSLTKAAVLNPEHPTILAALGKLLAQCDEYDLAAFYLKKAIAAAESLGSPPLPDAEAALAKIEQIEQIEAIDPPVAAHDTPGADAEEQSEVGAPRDDDAP